MTSAALASLRLVPPRPPDETPQERRDLEVVRRDGIGEMRHHLAEERADLPRQRGSAPTAPYAEDVQIEAGVEVQLVRSPAEEPEQAHRRSPGQAWRPLPLRDSHPRTA